jgi:hypothetical protein
MDVVGVAVGEHVDDNTPSIWTRRPVGSTLAPEDTTLKTIICNTFEYCWATPPTVILEN